MKNAKSIEEEKIKLEKGTTLEVNCSDFLTTMSVFFSFFSERDSALADLQSKKEEISSISSQIEETKAAFAKQESQLRSE